MLTALLLLCVACAFLVRANTTDAQLGALGPSAGPAGDNLLLGILRKLDKMEEDRAGILRKLVKMEEDRAQDKQELLRAIGEISEALAFSCGGTTTSTTAPWRSAQSPRRRASACWRACCASTPLTPAWHCPRRC
jgi:hypothetical protein